MRLINKNAKTENTNTVDLLAFSSYTIEQIEQAVRWGGSHEKALEYLQKLSASQPINQGVFSDMQNMSVRKPLVNSDTIHIGNDGTLLHL